MFSTKIGSSWYSREEYAVTEMEVAEGMAKKAIFSQTVNGDHYCWDSSALNCHGQLEVLSNCFQSARDGRD